VGGQAVIEGVMMRSPSKIAVAVLRNDGQLGFLERSFTSITRRVPILGLPIIRGAVSLFETLYLGITALNFSADEAVKGDPEGPPAKPGSRCDRCRCCRRWATMTASSAIGRNPPPMCTRTWVMPSSGLHSPR